jgi:predicted metal-dependent peptidase
MNDEEKAEATVRVIEDNAITNRTEKQIGKGTDLFGEALAHELNKSRHNWKKELKRNMIQSHRKSIELTWSRINRRAVHRGEYQQGRDNKGFGEIVICGDASGSMSTEEFQIGLDVVAAIAKMLKPETVHFIQWTDVVLSHEYIKPGGKFDVERKGSGGTEFAPVLQHIKNGGQCKKGYFSEGDGEMHKRIKNPTVIICLTDMFLDWDRVNANKPKAPVIFVDCFASAHGARERTAQEHGCTFPCKTITVSK